MRGITEETLAMFKQAFSDRGIDPASLPADLQKAFTQSGTATSGLTMYDLQKPALQLAPELWTVTPLRNSIPRAGGGTGIQANWRAVTGLNTTRVSIGLSEGNRGGITPTSTADYLAKFNTIGLDDNLSMQAEWAAEGFEDMRALTARNLLVSLMRGEETVLLGGQGTWGLAANGVGSKTPTPSGTLVPDSTFTGTMTEQATVCYCVALSLDGYLRSTITGGLPGQITRTRAGAYGGTDTINGGNCKVSSESTAKTTDASNHAVDWTVAAVPGAFAYAWYTGLSGAGNCSLTGITTTNKFRQTADAAGTQKANDSKITTDYSQDSTLFDGLVAIATKSASGSYYKSYDGAALNVNNDGSIEEIDTMLESFWGTGQTGNLRISPTDFFVNGSDARSIGKSIVSGSNAPVTRIVIPAGTEAVQGGGVKWNSYLNKVTGDVIKVTIHPDLPPGKLLSVARRIPYGLVGVPELMRVLARQEYFAVEWPRNKLAYEYGVYADEVLQAFFPPVLGVVDNFGSGHTIIA